MKKNNGAEVIDGPKPLLNFIYCTRLMNDGI